MTTEKKQNWIAKYTRNTFGSFKELAGFLAVEAGLIALLVGLVSLPVCPPGLDPEKYGTIERRQVEYPASSQIIPASRAPMNKQEAKEYRDAKARAGVEHLW
jgi:hypothetical protein